MLDHVGAWEKALAEAVRVLRPGGPLLGYDLLDTAPTRLLHVGKGRGTGLLRPAPARGRVQAVSIRIRRGIANLVVRLAASKAP